MNENDGGPIAPRMKLVSAYGELSAAQGSTFHPEGGLSLRDYFAAHATEEDVRALLVYGESWTSANDRAAARYRHADAMLAAR